MQSGGMTPCTSRAPASVPPTANGTPPMPLVKFPAVSYPSSKSLRFGTSPRASRENRMTPPSWGRYPAHGFTSLLG
ncbi:hypothetical protein CA235_18985 [Sphingomonas sp. ABOLF]|nr:hypothetical protein CA235_18985 [Sphingomonas sp. ABOLF]